MMLMFVNPTKHLGTFLWKGFDVVVVDGDRQRDRQARRRLFRGCGSPRRGLVQNYAMTMVLGMVVMVAIFVVR